MERPTTHVYSGVLHALVAKYVVSDKYLDLLHMYMDWKMIRCTCTTTHRIHQGAHQASQ
jgi:hypothetical protein